MSTGNLDEDDGKFSDISISEINANKSNNGDNSFEMEDKLRTNIPKRYGRKRSSSFQELRLTKAKSHQPKQEGENDLPILKQGLLKKKGILFYNNRTVTLNAYGILQYTDPKNLDKVRGEIDLKERTIIAKMPAKTRDQIEIISREGGSFIFKEMHKGDQEMHSWEEHIKKFTKIRYF